MGWRRSLRLSLVATILGVAGAVFFGLRDRVEPARALVVERADPDAVIQTRGSRIVQADALGENLEVVSGSQSTYADGAMRLYDGVEVSVADRDDRAGFGMVGQEATINADQTMVHMTGAVRMESSDGLYAETEDAEYTDTDGIIQMPGATTFRRDGMLASGDEAVYDRSADVLRLSRRAIVTLTDGAEPTRITSRDAMLAQGDGRMEFHRDVQIARGAHRMTARDAHVSTDVATSQMQGLRLLGGARIVGVDAAPGELREMSAGELELTYTVGGQIEHATLIGAASLDVAGTTNNQTSRVRGRSMEIGFGESGEGLRELGVEQDVTLTIPGSDGRPAQSVSADALTVASTTEIGLDAAEFVGGVEYRELDGDGATGASRITRADRLEASLGEGLAGLDAAHFFGSVVLENEGTVARADEATYDVWAGEVELLTTSGEAGQTPRLESDERGSIQAESIVLGLDDGRIAARGQVKSVLSGAAADGETGSSDENRRPGMLESGESIYVTAGSLVYDDESATTVYSEGAHLWQSVTKLDGETIVLDEGQGNMSASGTVRTESILVQFNDETGLPEESLTRGAGEQFDYDDAEHRATYVGDAELRGTRADLTAATIDVFLQTDGRTLERLEAAGEVELVMTGRWVTGASLVYYDVDGRYEMEGTPVRIIERTEQRCRETSGRSLTFFITDDAVSVDGASEVRTEAQGVACPPGASLP